MIRIDLRCWIRGDQFSEEEVISKTGLKIHSVKEKEINEKIQIKQFRRILTVLPQENGIFENDDQKLINKFSILIKDKVDAIKSTGCEQIVLVMGVFYKDQCNFSLRSEVLKNISEGFDDFYISCYEDSE